MQNAIRNATQQKMSFWGDALRDDEIVLSPWKPRCSAVRRRIFILWNEWHYTKEETSKATATQKSETSIRVGRLQSQVKSKRSQVYESSSCLVCLNSNKSSFSVLFAAVSQFLVSASTQILNAYFIYWQSWKLFIQREKGKQSQSQSPANANRKAQLQS